MGGEGGDEVRRTRPENRPAAAASIATSSMIRGITLPSLFIWPVYEAHGAQVRMPLLLRDGETRQVLLGT